MNEKIKTTWSERLSSPLTWHYVAAGILLVAVLVLAVLFGLDWAALREGSAEALASKQVQLKTLEIQTAPLRGLDKRVDVTREQISDFYGKRIPANYSQIATQIGELEVKSGVRLTRVQYAQSPPANNLTEIRIDAGISGAYPQIMHFINSMERDKTFFVITGMGLTGQQGGQVNLRLQMSTWLRNADAAASGIPATTSETPAGTTAAPASESVQP